MIELSKFNRENLAKEIDEELFFYMEIIQFIETMMSPLILDKIQTFII